MTFKLKNLITKITNRVLFLKVDLVFYLNAFLKPIFLFHQNSDFILKIFGARIYGWQIVIKPNVKIKYPWFLKIGDGSWIGEKVWIDNLCSVNIEENVCISQGVIF